MSELPKDLDRLHAAWTGIYTSEPTLRCIIRFKAAYLTPYNLFPEVDKGTVTREDWNDLYADYTATLDFPGAMFPRENTHPPPSLAHFTH